MSKPVPPDVLRRVKKLAQLPEEAKESRWGVSVTRLTLLKSLCEDAGAARRFAAHLARKTLEAVSQGKGRCRDAERQRPHLEMMAEALSEMEAFLAAPDAARRRRLRDLHTRMHAEQNEQRNIPFGAVRQIHDWDLLLVEEAVACLAVPDSEAPHWGYQLARDYAERYDSSAGTGLIASSVPALRDIADFWMKEFGITEEMLRAPARKKKAEKPAPGGGPDKEPTEKKAKPPFTHQQGQFLAFIHLYTKLHRRAPAETDFAIYFRQTPPSVHQMIVKLTSLGLITRERGVGRSVRLAVPESGLPPLEDVPGPPW